MNPSASAPVRPSRDAGMTLVEVMAAIALFAVMSTAVLVVLNATIKTSNESGQRVVAANLAARELEITRDIFSSQTRGPSRIKTGTVYNANPLPGGTAGQPLVVDGIPFTVTRSTVWRNIDSAAESTCDEGTTLEFDYLRVKVQVKWPGLGDRPPLTMDTQMTPAKGTYDEEQTKGHIGLKVLGRDGKGKQGVQVTARRGTGAPVSTVTADDGCALIDQVEPGNWTVAVNNPGFVTQQGDPTGTLTATVQQGKLWKGSISYDRAAQMEVVVCPPADYPLPAQLYGSSDASKIPVTLANSGLLPGGSKPFASSGSREQRRCPLPVEVDVDDGENEPLPVRYEDRVAEVRTLGSLWPYSSGYQVWMGGCLENDPQYTGQARELPVASDPGVLTETTVELVGLSVEGAPALTTLIATQVTEAPDGREASTDTSCRAGAVIELGTTLLGGTIKASLPYGRWKIGREGGGGTSDVVTVIKGGGPQTAQL